MHGVDAWLYWVDEGVLIPLLQVYHWKSCECKTYAIINNPGGTTIKKSLVLCENKNFRGDRMTFCVRRVHPSTCWSPPSSPQTRNQLIIKATQQHEANWPSWRHVLNLLHAFRSAFLTTKSQSLDPNSCQLLPCQMGVQEVIITITWVLALYSCYWWCCFAVGRWRRLAKPQFQLSSRKIANF